MKRFSPKISYKKHVHIMMRKLLCTLERVNLRLKKKAAFRVRIHKNIQ